MLFVSVGLSLLPSWPRAKPESDGVDVHHPEVLRHAHLWQDGSLDFVLQSHQMPNPRLLKMGLVVDPCPYLEVPIDYGDVREAVSVLPSVGSSAAVAVSDWEIEKRFEGTDFASVVVGGCIRQEQVARVGSSPC